MSIRVNNRIDNRRRLENTINDLKNTSIHVGIFGEQGSEILLIGNVQEYGTSINVTPKMRGYLASQGLHLKKSTNTITIPERSFIRKGYDDKKREIQREIDNSLDQVLTFRITLESFYNRVGERLVSIAKEYLTDLREPLNHPFTLKQKAPKDNPLLNTGQLRQSITWKKVRR
jgi:hypothetical protein